MKKTKITGSVKKITLNIVILHLKTVYFVFKLFPLENKVSFFSRQSDEIPLDYTILSKSLKDKDLNIKFSYSNRRLNKGLKSLFLFYFETIKQLYLFATSRICIIDSYNIVASTLKHKKETKIIQIWHSLGKFKQTGFQRLNKKSGLSEVEAKILKMHSNYDYLISGSKFWDKYYIEAFNMPKTKIKNFGLPRASYYQKNQEKIKKDFLNKYKQLKRKPIVLYAPTFRLDKASKYEEIIRHLDLKKYNLIIKLHPNDPDYKKTKPVKKGVYYFNNIKTIDIIPACDIVITDYSSLILESMLFQKPFLLFVYDIEEYLEANGLNFNFHDLFPMFMHYSAEEISENIKSKYDWDTYDKLKNKMLLKDFEKGYNLFVDLIIALLNGEK